MIKDKHLFCCVKFLVPEERNFRKQEIWHTGKIVQMMRMETQSENSAKSKIRICLRTTVCIVIEFVAFTEPRDGAERSRTALS